MELGRINVRGQNVNLLWEAIHPQHGLVWANGKTINLEKVSILNDQVENNIPLKLGEFEQPVQSVHWSCNIGPNTCYLCVVHSQHVSIWKVDGLVPKLNFKQVRKLNVQPIPQGCLWNPKRDILCVLAKQQCSFFFHHTQNKGSFALSPLESGKIRCGTWTTDGNKLVLCVGAVLLVYTWPDIDASISSFTSLIWKIPNLQGYVSSIVKISDSMVLCAAELPLENLCKVKDTFVVPDLNENRDRSQGDEIISPQKSGSITETLLSLPRNPQFDMETSTQLMTVSLTECQDPCKVSMTAVNGVLSPELLLYMPHIHSIIVGSNTQNTLQVFTFNNGDIMSNMIKTAEIKLDKQERPKGISSSLPTFPNQNGVLITVGKRASSDSAFLSSRSSSAMEIKLKFYPFHIDETILHNKKQNGTTCISSGQAQSVKSEDTQIEERVLINPSFSLDRSEIIHTEEIIDQEVKKDYETSKVDSDKHDVKYDRDLHITKQDTVTELNDFSESDPSNLSPREIIIGGSETKGYNPVIEDLSGSGDSETILETETTTFSENVPFFQNNYEKCIHDSIQNTVSYSEIENTASHLEIANTTSHSEIENTASHSEIENTASHSEIENTVSHSEIENTASHSEIENTASHSEIEQKYSKENPIERSDMHVNNGCLDDSAVSMATSGISIATPIPDSNKLERMQLEIDKLNHRIEELKMKVGHLANLIQESTIITKYQSQSHPELIQIMCQCSGMESKTKSFLLDNGRLPYEAVRRTFDLVTLEIFIDEEPCVVSPNIDGYIPIRFTPSTTLTITGKTKVGDNLSVV